jgi:hypothetical protein
MPLRADAAADQPEADPHHGLPLHGLSADDRQRLFLERRNPERRLCGDRRGAHHRGPAGRDAPLFLPLLHELDVHAPRGHGMVRQRTSDDARHACLVDPFIETWTKEKLPWATTPDVRSYETFPRFEDYEEIVQAYRRWAEG